MKNGIHPTVNPVVFIDVSTNDQIITSSTLTTDETMDINGVKHYVVRIDITSFSHPFFTGEVRFVDEKGRVEEYRQRVAIAAAKRKVAAERSAKKQKPEEPQADPQSYQELLRQQQQALRAAKAKTQPTE